MKILTPKDFKTGIKCVELITGNSIDRQDFLQNKSQIRTPDLLWFIHIKKYLVKLFITVNARRMRMDNSIFYDRCYKNQQKNTFDKEKQRRMSSSRSSIYTKTTLVIHSGLKWIVFFFVKRLPI